MVVISKIQKVIVYVGVETLLHIADRLAIRWCSRCSIVHHHHSTANRATLCRVHAGHVHRVHHREWQMLESMEGIGSCDTPMERLGNLLEALTDRWRKRAAEIREESQLTCNERRQEDFACALFK